MACSVFKVCTIVQGGIEVYPVVNSWKLSAMSRVRLGQWVFVIEENTAMHHIMYSTTPLLQTSDSSVIGLFKEDLGGYICKYSAVCLSS